MDSIFKLTNHEVFVITSQHTFPAGFAATWVLPASLIPGTPRLMFLASPQNTTTKIILESKRFVIHLLSKHQAAFLPRFGLESSKDKNKFKDVPYTNSEYGPILDNVVGYHLCRLVKSFDIGERLIMIGDVDQGKVDSTGVPLQKKDALESLPPDIVTQLVQKQKALGESARDLFKNLI